ncbi:hypothetical protein ACFX2A_005196 [Malus domestica]
MGVIWTPRREAVGGTWACLGSGGHCGSNCPFGDDAALLSGLEKDEPTYEIILDVGLPCDNELFPFIGK